MQIELCNATKPKKTAPHSDRWGILTAAFLSLSALGLPVSVRAAPMGGVVTEGQASIAYQGPNTNINQSTPYSAVKS